MSIYKKYASEEQLNKHLRLSRCTAQLPSGMKNNYITYGNGKYVAVASGTNKCAYSSDGVNWTEAQLPTSSSWNKILYGNGIYVAACLDINECVVAYSNDLINWQQSTIPCSTKICDIVYGNGTFIAIPYEWRTTYCSTDGVEWRECAGFKYSKWHSAVYGNGCFVICGEATPHIDVDLWGDEAYSYYDPNIAYSYDGINWYDCYEDKFDRNEFKKVVYGNGRFVILCQESLTGVYSENGKDWTQLTIPVKVRRNSLTFGNGKFVVFTADGSSVLTSSDGIDWDIHELSTQFNVRDIAYGKDRFIATLSDSASVIISYDGENWYEDDALRQGSEDVTSAVKAVLGLENAASKDYVDAGLEEAKEYTDSKQLAGVETSRISYNSYTDTKEIIPYGNQHYARVLDTPITLTSENFKSVTMGVFWPNNINMVLEYTQEKGNASIRAVDEVGGAICIFGTDPDGKPVEYPIVAIFEQDLPAESAGVDISKGVYFFTAEDAVGNEAFIIKIDLEYETIRKIDPKFIPDTVATKDDVATAVSETKEYVDRICRIEKTIFTWDGDRTGKTVVGDDYFTYVRLYSAVAPETITKAAVMTIGGAVEYTADAFTITELSGTGYAISINSIIGILVVPEDCDFAIAGTYAATNCDGAPTTSTEFYTSCIETETIHPIDPKFLPGVCLPVVELSTTLDIGTEPVNLSAEDCSAMTAVASTGTPIALKYTLNGGAPIFSVASLGVGQAGDAAVYFYGAMSALEGIITIRVLGNPESGQWKAFVTQG